MICCIVGLSYYLFIGRRIKVEGSNFGINEDTRLAINLDTGQLTRKYTNCRFYINLPPSHGALIGSPPNIVYQPMNNYYGADSFTYSVQIGNRISNQAEIKLSIHPVNDPPKALEAEITADEDTSVSINLAALDPDDEQLIYYILNMPNSGTLSGDPPHLIYKPDSDYFGEDRFTFAVRDRNNLTDNAEIKLILRPINDSPVVFDTKITTFQNAPVNICLSSRDPENESVTFLKASSPENGLLKGGSARYVYFPKRDFIGQDRIQYQSSDGRALSRTATVTIQVLPTKIGGDEKAVFSKVAGKASIASGNGPQPDFLLNRGVFPPASVLKIATASAALYYLKKDMRFKTEIYLDESRNIYLKGFGDPHFTTKDWFQIAGQLSKNQHFRRPINALILDDSVFTPEVDYDGRRKSINYYEAPLGALVTNHNTAVVRLLKNGQIVPWDRITPITPIIRKRVRGLPKGVQYLNVGETSKDGTFYSGEVAKAVFEKSGATFNGKTIRRAVPGHLKPILVYQSRGSLEGIIRKMLKDSNNFIANQLLLAIALEKNDYPVNLRQGVDMMIDFLTINVGIPSCNFNIVEGSGLSPKNRIDLLGILKLLNYFSRYKQLMPSLALSKYPHLRKTGRKLNIIAKSGALTEVTNLAGYIPVKEKPWVPFVLMFRENQAWEDCADMLEKLTDFYRSVSK